MNAQDDTRRSDRLEREGDEAENREQKGRAHRGSERDDEARTSPSTAHTPPGAPPERPNDPPPYTDPHMAPPPAPEDPDATPADDHGDRGAARDP